MDWNGWIGKKLFLRLKSGKVYSGICKEVADVGNGLIFISIIDKFGKWVTFTAGEIVELKEEA